MDSIIPTRAPKVANQYFLGDMPLDEGTFGKLSKIKLMADAGLPDKFLMDLLTESLFSDPRQTELETMTLRQNALAEASTLRELGLNEEADRILTQYGYNAQPAVSNITKGLQDANLSRLEQDYGAIQPDDKDFESKVRENLLKQDFYKAGQTVPSDRNLGYDKDKGQLYFEPKEITLQDRIEALMARSPQDRAGSVLLNGIIPGLSLLNEYGAAGDIASQRKRQYL